MAHSSSQDLQSSSILVGLQLKTLGFMSAYNGSIILISGDTGGQSLNTQMKLSRKEVTSLDLWHGPPPCWKILCASYIGNKPLVKTFDRDTVGGFWYHLLLWRHKPLNFYRRIWPFLWYISHHIYTLVVGGHIVTFSSKFPLYICL